MTFRCDTCLHWVDTKELGLTKNQTYIVTEGFCNDGDNPNNYLYRETRRNMYTACPFYEETDAPTPTIEDRVDRYTWWTGKHWEGRLPPWFGKHPDEDWPLDKAAYKDT